MLRLPPTTCAGVREAGSAAGRSAAVVGPAASRTGVAGSALRVFPSSAMASSRTWGMRTMASFSRQRRSVDWSGSGSCASFRGVPTMISTLSSKGVAPRKGSSPVAIW